MAAALLDPAAAVRLVLENCDAEGAEVIAEETTGGLTRFANSEIHQNVAERTLFLRVRVIEADRVGVASTNQLDEDSLKSALERARAVAAAQEPQPGLPALPGPAEVAPLPVVRPTVESTPLDRAEQVSRMCAVSDAAGQLAFGAVSATTSTYTIANTRGLFLATPRSVARSRMVAMTPTGASGFGARASQSAAELDVAAVAEEAVDRARRYTDPVTLPAGRYPVVMEAEAVGEILEHLTHIGFGALAVEEGRTFMRPGEQVTGDLITIWDDGQDPAGLPMPFDFEGVGRRRVELVRAGRAVGVVHDLATAARAGVASTGHGQPAPNPYGPLAGNLFMAGGDAPSAEELCAGIERGIWVTRLWYVNVVEPTGSVLTGMTRDGTFLVEDGRVTRAVKNMRFTQSIMDAFAACSAATRETKLVAGADYGYISGYRVPALRLDRFNFTSATR